MTFSAHEQLVGYQRANVATLFALAKETFNGCRKLIELNLQVAKSTIAKDQGNLQNVLSGKGIREVFPLHGRLMQPAAETFIAYSRHLHDIGAAPPSCMLEGSANAARTHWRNVQALIQHLIKHAPAGMKAAAAALQSAFAAAHNSYERVHPAARHATDVANTNVDAAATVASHAARHVATRAAPRSNG